jgi:hypothetical protein
MDDVDTDKADIYPFIIMSVLVVLSHYMIRFILEMRNGTSLAEYIPFYYPAMEQNHNQGCIGARSRTEGVCNV